jgi:hypothetical protein
MVKPKPGMAERRRNNGLLLDGAGGRLRAVSAVIV